MSPAIILSILSPSGAVENLRFEQGVVMLGREPENEIVLDSTTVSRQHAMIFAAGSHWLFRDLGSTNGSWLNSLQVHPSQTKLLRGGDKLQIADCHIDIGVDGRAHLNSSLLIFLSERFQSEFPMLGDGSSFVVGGPEGHVYIEGDLDETKQLEILMRGGRLELSAGLGDIPVHVNGVAVSGPGALSDGDEVSVGPYRILVNLSRQDFRSREYQPSVQATPRASSAMGDWEADLSRKQVARRMLFGQEERDKEDPTQTVSMGSKEFNARSGFEMNVSRRMSALNLGDEMQGPRGPNKAVLALLAVTLLLVICLVIFILLQLST